LDIKKKKKKKKTKFEKSDVPRRSITPDNSLKGDIFLTARSDIFDKSRKKTSLKHILPQSEATKLGGLRDWVPVAEL